MSASLADGTPTVNVTVDVEREVLEVDETGQTLRYREPVRDAMPGDVLVYTLTAANTGVVPAFNARLEDPIPPGTVLLIESVELEKQAVQASLDGGKSWQPFPAVVDRPKPDGSVEKVPAPAEAYTHLSWVFEGDFKPGQERRVSFKVAIR